MQYLTPEQVDLLADRVEHHGGEMLSIENDLEQIATKEMIEEIQYEILCELEKTIQSAIIVNPMPTNGSTLQFYCHMKNTLPEEHDEAAALIPGVRNDINKKDLQTICKRLIDNSATIIAVRREEFINEHCFYDGIRTQVKRHTEAKFNTPMTVRILDTLDERTKQVFVCFEGYGDFRDDDSLGPLE